MKLLLYICLFLFPMGPLTATIPFSIQQKSITNDKEQIKRNPVPFDQEQLNYYKKQPEFDYSHQIEDSWWSQFKRYVQLQWNNLLNWIFGDIPTGGFLYFLLQVLPYIILVGLLFLIIWLFRRLNPAKVLLRPPSQEHILFDEEEEIVQKRDINSMIEKALASNDYKTAIRYQYLLVLQILNQQHIITYQSAKTNEEYAQEIRSEALRSAFRQLSRIYDYTWYGSFMASQETFENMQQDLQLVVRLSGFQHEQK